MTDTEFPGLVERPFGLTSDPRFLFSSRGFMEPWQEVVRTLHEGHRGLVIITGDRGVGKRTFCRALIEGFGAETFLSAISDPTLEPGEFLNQVLTDFSFPDDPPAAGPPGAEAIGAFLNARAGARAIILIDEAQQVSAAVFDEIRRLMALRLESTRLHVLLVGPPELSERLRQPHLRWTSQIVACSVVLRPLQRDEVGPYIDRRLRVAATPRPDLPPDAVASPVTFLPVSIAAIAEASAGNPRLVNVLANRALEIAASRKMQTIDRATALAAIAKEGLAKPTWRWARVGAAAAAIAVVAVSAALLAWRSGLPAAGEAPAAAVESAAPVVEVSPPTIPDAQPAAPEAPPAAEQASALPGPPIAGTLEHLDSHLVSIGPFDSRERASAVVREIAAKGLPAFARPDPSGVLTWVMVGPYLSREEAVDAQRLIAPLGYPDVRVVVEDVRR